MSTTADLVQIDVDAAAASTLCNLCHGPVLVTVGLDRKRRVLTPVRVAGGLYSLDSDGRAVRRRAVDLSQEYRHGRALRGGGYEPHNCRRVR